MKIKTLLLIALLICFSSVAMLAQDEETLCLDEELTAESDTLSPPDVVFYLPESWEKSLDDMMNSWQIQKHARKTEHPAYNEQHTVSDSVYVDRLFKLHNIIELPFNDVVRTCINLYTERRRNSVEYMLGLEDFYFPMIEQALDENDLPDELKYLAVVESALNPIAVSRAGATGLWQFMLPTGKQYGLEINSLIDERRDPVRATYAACRYLKDLYNIYSDWALAIAAYNCGPGNVNKAIKRSGGKTDYWEIYPYLPKETRSYVPLFIAATYVMNYYPYHQLYPVAMDLPAATDTVMINNQVHFNQIVDVLEVDIETLRALNPQYKQDVIPGHIQPRSLKLPAVQAYAYAQHEDSIPNHRIDELFPNRMIAGSYSASKTDRITHKVQSGETLAQIASRYGVSMSDIRKWNGLKSNKIGIGRNLVIHANNGGYNLASNNSTTKASTTTQSTTKKASNHGTYKVKRGDTLSTIAQKYRCSYKHLMQINGFKNTKIQIGQIIKVPS